MGAQQSQRTLIVENENNVIKVSEKVVERLKGTIENIPPNSQNAPPPRSVASTVSIHPLKTGNENGTENIGGSLTSLEVKKQYEEEIEKNNVYWQNRIKGLQESHQRINETWDSEYKRAIKEVEENFPKPPPKGGKTPCSQQKTVVLDCYKKNAGKTLKCFNEVQAFSDCMNNIRGDSNKN